MRRPLVILALAAAAGLVWWLWPAPPADRVVLYCAQDKDFADWAVDAFKARSGLEVAVKFDTEANKSVALYKELVADRGRPRCDVFWNNEILSTIRLRDRGLLEPYDSPAARGLEPFPPSARAPDGSWHAFAARARVLLVNTDLVPEADWPRSLLDLADDRFAGRAAMAKPNHGMAATQAACLFEVLGADAAKAYYLRLKKNGVQLAPGNKDVAEWVGRGRSADSVVAVGVTDTDDALAEVRAGRPVKMIFPDRAGGPGRMGTLFVPNTVAVLKGCPNPAGARRLVDFLLGAEVEERLAETGGHQVPFRPELRPLLPRAVEAPPAVRAMEVDFVRAAALWDEAQAFLRAELTGG